MASKAALARTSRGKDLPRSIDETTAGRSIKTARMMKHFR
jgi:hypothetical protein